MKRILSLILAIGMLFTMAPVSIMAQDVLATAKTGASAYEAKVGETISVPFQIVPTSGELSTGIVSAGILVPEGLTYTVTAGIAQPADDENVFVLDPDMINIWYEASAKFTAESNTLCTVNFTATKAGEYNVGFDPEFVDLLDGSLNPLASAYDGNIVTQGAKLTFKADAPAADADFDKFKAKGVNYDAGADTDLTGAGAGMNLNSMSIYKIYNVATEEGLAEFKADPNYASLGATVEKVISDKKASYASYTDKDSTFNYVTYEGKAAVTGENNIATKFDGNWKACLGSSFVYWKITDSYFASTDKEATFVIQYYDAPAGNFTLKYSKQGNGTNAITVEKTGEAKWVTKAFHVTDAMLNNNLTATGLIDDKHTGRFEIGHGTYVSKFAVLKTADYYDITGTKPEEPEIPDVDDPEDLPEDPAGDDACGLIKNSTYYGGEGFEYTDKKDMEISSADIAGLTESYTDRTKGSDAYIVADPANADNGLVLKVDHDQRISGTNSINNEIKKVLGVETMSDYIVMSHKFWYPAGAYIRFYPNFTFKKYSDGSTMSGVGFSNIIQSGNIGQEGAAAGAGASTIAGKWSEWDFVIDAKDLKAYLYIDHQYHVTFDFTTGANNKKPSKADYYISGVADYTFRFDRTSGPGPLYFDDIQVRAMTKDQYAAAFGADTVEVAGTSITTAEALPTKSKVYGNPVVWTTNNDDVTVAADGYISVADATVTYEDVEFTASFAGVTKKFTLDVKKKAKYAEYIFGAKEDKAYGLSSFNVTDNYYTQNKDGLKIRNAIVKFDEARTFYYVANDKTSTSDTADSHQVTKEEYDAYDGIKKTSYNVQYYNTSSNSGDSACNRYDAVGPDADKRAAIWGTGHLRNDGRLTRKWTNSMIHFDVGSTFSSSDNALVIEVDVLDVGTHSVNLQYCNKAGAVGSVNSDKLTNTGEWITLTYNLTDADFAWTKNTGLGNNKQDFRFQLNLPTYISAVRIYDVEKVEVAEADYAKVAVADYDVMINDDNSITAKTAITAEEAKDAKLYVAFYNAKGDLVGVATSAQVTDGAAQTLVTGKSVGATYNTVDYTLKTFVWDADLKPLR